MRIADRSGWEIPNGTFVVNSNFVPAPDPADWRPEVPPPPGIFDVTVGQGFAFVPDALNIQGQQRP